jgi:hypothetical protein
MMFDYGCSKTTGMPLSRITPTTTHRPAFVTRVGESRGPRSHVCPREALTRTLKITSPIAPQTWSQWAAWGSNPEPTD